VLFVVDLSTRPHPHRRRRAGAWQRLDEPRSLARSAARRARAEVNRSAACVMCPSTEAAAW